MTEFVRPPTPVQQFRDAAGAVIPYGSRWPDGPPDEAYSVTSNTERYAPLHTVAEALITWLVDSYEVEVVDDLATASDLLTAPESVVRSVRLVPADLEAAPITFVLSGFPGVFLHAGHLHDSHFPSCGCDACDESVDGCLDDLEWVVRTIVCGGFTETVTPGPQSVTSHSLLEDGVGGRSGGGDAFSFVPEPSQQRTRVSRSGSPGPQTRNMRKSPADDGNRPHRPSTRRCAARGASGGVGPPKGSIRSTK